jgi:hypothetical protein
VEASEVVAAGSEALAGAVRAAAAPAEAGSSTTDWVEIKEVLWSQKNKLTNS